MAGGYSVTIAAVDKVSTTIGNINRQFASMTAPVTRLNDSFKKFSDVSGLKAVYGSAEKLGGSMARLAKSASMIVAPIGAITSGASLAGLVALTTKFGEFGTQLGIQAQNIGISVQNLHGFENAMRLSGVSADASASSMQNLSTSITDAAGGRNMAALGYFRQLHLNLRDANGTLKTASQLMPEVADALHSITNPALRLRVGAAFGLDAASVAVLSKDGSAGLAKNLETAKKFGILNADGIVAAGKMLGAMELVKISVEGLGYSVAQKLSPVMSDLMTRLANWVNGGSKDVSNAVGDIAKQFDDWVKGGGLQKTIGGMTDFAAGTDSIVKALGGWKLAAEGLGAVLVLRILSPLLSILGVMARIALAWPTVALPAAVILGAGAIAGSQNMPVVDDLGNVVDGGEGNWGGNAGSRAAARAVAGMSPNGFRSEAGMEHADALHKANLARGPFTRLGDWVQNQTAGLDFSSSSVQPPKAGTEAAGVMEQARAFFKGKGYTDAQVAGILTNIGAESNFNPTLSHDGGSGYGLFGHRAERRDALFRYAGTNTPSVQQQLEYFDNELNGSEKTSGDALRRLTTAGQSAFAVNGAERPAHQYERGIQRAGAANSFLSGPYSQPPVVAGATGALGAAPTVKVEISHTNAPAGTAMKTTTSGNVIATAKVQTTALLDPH